MSKPFLHAVVSLSAMTYSGVVLAHPGHAGGTLAGFLHPLLGLDHLLAMLAVGIWAAQLGGRARWLVPASFVLCMALAAAVAIAGIGLPSVESGIAVSVLLAGLLIAFSVRVHPAIGGAVAAVFALFHGYAHGSEMPVQSSAILYGVGFLVSTALLHVAGIAVGGSLRYQRWLIPATGSAIATWGGWLFGAMG